MVLSLLIVNMFVLPVAIAFFTDDLSPSWIAFNSISDGMFMLDIVLNFKTGVLVHGTPNVFILDPKKIAVRYVQCNMLAFSFNTNKPFPSYLVLPCHNESSCETIQNKRCSS